ncbi:hypothetical protein NC653_033678 [Populus alba x Populus x berolinensis]|uniref:Uncharacterized protein n=1 Tax=Populus alba x Populus x berolinensis TaxID=444605 RepID=A0AAD6LUN7_9ROSI|nr:hypothetical protein NC653_033678 [Populus alba x Populus x berolinensis]
MALPSPDFVPNSPFWMVVVQVLRPDDAGTLCSAAEWESGSLVKNSMQASKQLRGSGISGRFLYQQMQEVEAYCKPQSRTLDRQIYSSGSTQGTPFTIPNSHEQYCTLESSSANGSYAAYNSPSTVSFSPNGSPLSQQESQSYSLEPRHSPDNASGSPLSGSCITDDAHDFRHKLRELETVMFGPDSDIIDSIENALESGTNIESLEMESWRQIMDQLNALNFLAFPGLGRTRSWCFAVRICSLSQSIRYSDSEGSPSESLAILVS